MYNGCISNTTCAAGRWWYKINGDPIQFSICQFCYDSGCYDRRDLVSIDIEKTKFSNFICSCREKDNHPSLKVGACIGKYETGKAKWFVPINDPECHICQHCYENGCVDRNNMTEINTITAQSMRSTCKCILVHSHIVPIICPTCSVMPLRINNPECKCQKCGVNINPNNNLCTRCSFKYKWCIYCQNQICEGNKCVASIIQTANEKQNMTSDASEKIRFGEIINWSITTYLHRTTKQIYDGIVNEASRKCDCWKCQKIAVSKN